MSDCRVNPREDKEIDVQIDTSIPVFDDFKTAKYHKLTDFAMGQVFMKYAIQRGWTPADLLKEDNLQRVAHGLKAYFDNMLTLNAKGQDFVDMSDEAFKDIDEIILPQWNHFIGHYNRVNPIIKTDDFVFDADFQDDNDSTVNDSSVEEGESVSDEEDREGKDFDRDPQGESSITLADKEVKVIFRLIPKTVFNKETGKVELFYDRDGLPTTAEFGSSFNLLLDKMANTKDFEEFKAKLQDIDTVRITPEAQFISDILKLNKPANTYSLSEYNFANKFYQVFSKPKVQIQSIIKQVKKSGDRYLVIDEISGNKRAIQQQFVSNFQLGKINNSVKQYVLKHELQGYYINPKASIPKPTTQVEQEDFLSLLGIKFSGTAFLDTESKREDYQNMLNNTMGLLWDNLNNRLTAGEIISEPVFQLRKQYSTEDKNVKSEAKSIDTLVDFEGKYSRITPSNSTRNAEGKLQYLISLDNQLTIATYHLNHSNTLNELLSTSPFRNSKFNPLFRNSHVIRYLFGKDGNKIAGRTVDLTNLSGMKEEVGKRYQSKLERALSSKKKFIQDFNMMFLVGRTDVPRTETSNTFYSVGLQENGQSRFIFAANQFVDDFKGSGQLRLILFNYLNAEIARIKSYDEKKEENSTLPDTYREFSIFYELFSTLPDLGRRLSESKFNMDSPIFNEFMRAYEGLLNGQVAAYRDTMTRLDISSDELITPSLKESKVAENLSEDALIRAFIANSLVQNIEFSILYSGDPLFFKGDYHKRIKGLVSTGDLAATHSLFKEYRQSPYERGFQKNYSAAGALNIIPRANDKNFQTQTVIEHRQDPKTWAYTKPNIVEDIHKSIIRRDGSEGKFTQDYIRNEVLAKAAKQDPADGQGYISLDFHRELALRFGFHTPEMEQAYKYEGLIFRRDIVKDELTDEQIKELETLEALILDRPDGYAIPVIKMTYWGNIENSTVDAKAYDKFSTAPLLPSDVKNHPKLAQLLRDMTNNQVGYVKYESGTKLFKTTPISIDQLSSATHDLYSTELLKLQIKPKSAQKSYTAIPTQMLKLIFSNLFNEGKPSNDKVKDLYQRYINTLKGIQKLQTTQLLDELGFSEDGLDIQKLSKRLIKQAKAQQQNSTVIEALQVADNSLRGVLEESGFLNQVVDMVSGISDKRLRRYEIPGGDFVLVTNANRSKLNFYTYSEDGTKGCDCRITLTPEYRKLLRKNHPDGKPIGTLDRLNKLLENDNWREENRKSLTVILNRVPTQGPNSIDFAVVKEFLSPTLGNVVIMPDEIVYKSGTDFDYDKEKVLTPSFTNNAEYVDISNVPEQIEELKRQRQGILDEFYTSKNPSKNIEKIRDYIKDITNIVTRGEFSKLKLSARSESDMQNVQETFTKVVNLEIAKEYLESQIRLLEDYDKYTESEEPEILTATSELNVKDTIEELRDEINVLTETFYDNVSQFRKGAVFQAINEGYKFRDRIIALLQLQDMEFEHHSNQVVETYAETLSLPEMFAELVIPNSTRITRPIADNNAKLTGQSLELPSRNKVFNYLDNLNVRNTFFDAKNMLAFFAINNTYEQLLQYNGINLNHSYYSYGPKGKKPRSYIAHLLLSPEERAAITSGNKIRTSLRDDIDGYIKQHFDSETINATVDSAKDPWFALFRIILPNVSVVNFMKNMGYPFERIIDFINQPVLLKYYELQANGLKRRDAIIAMAPYLGLNTTSNPSEESVILSQYNTLKNNPNVKIISERKSTSGKYIVKYSRVTPMNYYQILNTLQAIDEKGALPKIAALVGTRIKDTPITPTMLKEGIKGELRPDDYNTRIFAHFVSMEKHSQAFRNFREYFNFEKRKVTTPTNVRDKIVLRALMESEGMISKEDIQTMEQDSIIAPFINNNTLIKIFNGLFPLVGRNDVQDRFSRLNNAYKMNFAIRNQTDLENMPKVLNSDFVRAILFNFNIEDGKSFIERNRHLIIRQEGKRTITDRLQALKEQEFYNDLATLFPVLDNLQVSKHKTQTDGDFNGIAPGAYIENVQLIKPTSETNVEAESIIQQLRDLQSYEIKGYSKEKDALYTKALQKFVVDLFNTGILQSGIDKTYIGFSEYIPTVYKRSLFKPALDNLKNVEESEFSNFLSKFASQFRINNPKYFPRIKVKGGTIANPTNYSYRFKPYNIKVNIQADDVDDEDENPGDSIQPSSLPPVEPQC